MRPTAAPFVCSLALCLALASAAGPRRAHAGEEKPAPAPARDDDAAQARAERDRIAAGVIGRGLLSPDEAVRRTAVDRLVARLREGGEVEPFLRAMGDAIGDWANQQDRLLEVWLDQAVNGTAEERDQAVLLLTALGAKAVRRLALELRHAGRHEGRVADKFRQAPKAGTRWVSGAEVDEAKAEEAKAAEAETREAGAETATADGPAAGPELAAGEPRRYDVGDLLVRGWKHFDLRNMLRKQADAVSVRQFASSYVVTAQPEGHKHLGLFLARLRAPGAPQKPGAGSEPASPAASGETQADGSEPAAGSARDLGEDGAQRSGAKKDDGRSGERAQRATRRLADPAPSAPVPLNRAMPAWRLAPELLHLPRGGLLAARLSAEDSLLRQRDPIRPASAVIVGSLSDARRWAGQARKMPDARGELPLQGPTEIAVGETAKLFAGKEIRYSKDVEQTKGGAWRLVTDTVRHGIALEVAVVRDAEGLRVTLSAQRTDVGLPMPVMTVQPSERAAPVELEWPQWSTTRLARSFRLPAEGGGALLPLEGLGRGEDDEVVLVLAIEPYRPAPQQVASPR